MTGLAVATISIVTPVKFNILVIWIETSGLAGLLGMSAAFSHQTDLQVQVSQAAAQALIGVTVGGFTQQHVVLHSVPVPHHRLLLMGYNPYVPVLWCLQYLDLHDGTTIFQEWRYKKYAFSNQLNATKEGFIAWQVMCSSCHRPFTILATITDVSDP